MTNAIKETIEITSKRREKQIEYNKTHNITPRTTIRELDTNLKLEDHGEIYDKKSKLDKMPKSERQKLMNELKAKMLVAAKNLEFEEAARLRDRIAKIKNL